MTELKRDFKRQKMQKKNTEKQITCSYSTLNNDFPQPRTEMHAEPQRTPDVNKESLDIIAQIKLTLRTLDMPYRLLQPKALFL